MEVTGVKLDVPALHELDTEFSTRLDQLTRAIYGYAGGEFNINSTRQLGEVLYDRLQLPSLKLTRKGKVASTDAEALESLADQHPVVPLIIEHRSIQKLKSTYIDGLRALVDPVDGRIRTVLHQTVASTGRLSSAEPNLQNIPIREELGRRIRRAFVASGPEWQLLAADYSQIELRVLAHLSGDKVLTEAFELDQDIHKRTASEVFGVDLDAVSPSMRQAAKAVNFGIIYGISDFGLARNLGVGRAEAGTYIAQYFARYPRVNEFFTETIARARRDGYVTTILGRRRQLPDLFDNNFNIRAFGERTARNTPIQGSAADIIKVAMVRLDAEIRNRRLRGRMVLQVHDELLFDVPRDELAAMQELALDRMQHAYPLRVPLKVDAKTGSNWYEAK
jgi:DNA polymerase-1